MIPTEPQPDAAAILERDDRVFLPVYARYDAVFTGGDGVFLTDVAGKRYLDTVSGLGVNALGYAHPRMVATMREQAGSLIHLSNLYSSRYPGDLAERLCALTGMAAVFYCTGGTEAMESALKIARSAAFQGYGERKHIFVSVENSYHGRTFGALSVTGQQKYRDGFEPGMPPARFVPRNDVRALKAAMDEDVCGILVEPVMGEGGVHETSAEFLREARRLADQYHAALILDEIQCGLGRTGVWSVGKEMGVAADILVVGKPLGGGLPLSAILVREQLRDVFSPGKHGSTLGGGVLATRLGLEFLSIVEDEGLLDRARSTGAYLNRCLRQVAEEHACVTEVRGRGFLQGLVLDVPARPIAEAALPKGVLLNVIQGSILRFLPPYLFEPVHVDQVVEVLDEVLRDGRPVQSASAAMEDATLLA